MAPPHWLCKAVTISTALSRLQLFSTASRVAASSAFQVTDQVQHTCTNRTRYKERLRPTLAQGHKVCPLGVPSLPTYQANGETGAHLNGWH